MHPPTLPDLQKLAVLLGLPALIEQEKKKIVAAESDEVFGGCPFKHTKRDYSADIVQQIKTRLKTPLLALRLVFPPKSTLVSPGLHRPQRNSTTDPFSQTTMSKGSIRAAAVIGVLSTLRVNISWRRCLAAT